GLDANALRQRGDFLRDKEPSVVGVLAGVNDGKITIVAVCGPEAVKKGIKAGELVKRVCGICGGKGGGKPESAMGGGSDLLKLDDALAAVDDFIVEKLGG
ncbi:MAG: alanine--tRNA ligase, partial [Oscillibacter sp.]|nr:alanine--tRNA ligase [Oscillibacter sp.]